MRISLMQQKVKTFLLVLTLHLFRLVILVKKILKSTNSTGVSLLPDTIPRRQGKYGNSDIFTVKSYGRTTWTAKNAGKEKVNMELYIYNSG